MRSTFVLSALSIIVPTLGAPTVVPIIKRAGPVKPDSYIIKFKYGSSKQNLLETITRGFTRSGSIVTYNYDPLFDGFAATLLGSDLTRIQRLPEVEYIEQDLIMSLSYERGIDGLPSVDEEIKTSPTTPPEMRWNDGEGVTIYGIDTGIYTDHECFGGRARWGATFGNYSNADGNGHGTHTAGTAVGRGFGFATGAEIVAVKVLGDNGSGSLSDVMNGVVYAYNQFVETRRPSIATMSLGAPGRAGSRPLEDTIRNATRGGLHFTIGAGNSNQDVKFYTPARVSEANTIGAVDSNADNEKAIFSNYGELIDVWAPGVNITSAWIGKPDAVMIASGTSMATPYVAGILAVVLSKDKYRQISPQELSDQLKQNAAPVVKFDDPRNQAAKSAGSNNLLAKEW